MADIARLGFSADTKPLQDAKKDLDAVSSSAKSAGAATDKFNQSASKMGAGLKSVAGGLPGLTQGLGRAASGAGALEGALSTAASGFSSMSRGALLAGTAAGSAAVNLNRVAAAASGANGALDAHVREWQRLNAEMVKVPAAANGAKSSLDRLGAAATDNINRMQATPGNVAAQFSDIGVTAAGGMQPWLIALQQGTQLGAAMSGGLKTLAAGFMSLLSPVNLLAIGLTFAIALIIQWGVEALKAGDSTDKLQKAIDDTQITTYAFKDAQSALGGVIDLTTGKINTQSEALRGLARAQLEMIRAQALADRSKAASAIAEERGRNRTSTTIGFSSMSAGAVGARGTNIVDLGPTRLQSALDAFSNGKATSTQTIDNLEKLRKETVITEDAFIKLTGAVASFGVAGENLKVYEDARKALGGDQGALQQFLNPPKTKTPSKGRSPGTTKKQDDPWGDLLKDADQQQTSLEQAGARVGVYGEALDRLTFMQDLFNKANQKGIKLMKDGTIELNANGLELQRRATIMAAQAQDNRNAQFLEDMVTSTKAQTDALMQERAQIGLTGTALYEMQAYQALYNQAVKDGVDITTDLITRMHEHAAAIAAVKGENDKLTKSAADQAEQLKFTKETIKGVFTEWVQNVRNGQSVWGAFADAVLNALNKIMDRLLDQALSTALDALMPKKDGSSGATNSLALLISDFFAKGGTFGAANDNVSKFAKGGTFTNSIVDRPTLFKFAKGTGMMGEAGPEAIMPLKRGSDGSLGVQMHGSSNGGTNVAVGGSTYNIGGVMTPEAILAAIRQGDENSKNDIRTALPGMLHDYQQNGTMG